MMAEPLSCGVHPQDVSGGVDLCTQSIDPFELEFAALMEEEIPAPPTIHQEIAEAVAVAKKTAAVPKLAKVRTELCEVPGIFVMAPEFDPAENFLDTAQGAAFKSTPLFEETDLLTQPVNTTNTASGFISNVNFLEEELIGRLAPSADAVIIKCNYGELRYCGYTKQPKKPKSNRGRKKKERVKKERKHQGDGEAMNSQITVSMVSPMTPVQHDDEHNAVFDHANIRTFGIKVFRNGVVQLPGTVFGEIGEVVPCFRRVTAMLNSALHDGEIDPEKRCYLVNLNYVMKNFKFALKIPADMRIDLIALRRVLNHRAELRPVTEMKIKWKNPQAMIDREHDIADGGEFQVPDSPYRNFTPCYNCEKIKLSVKFFTPRPGRMEKTTHFNVFRSGKINILGSQCRVATAETAVALGEIIRANWDKLIYREGEDIRDPYVPETNIVDSDPVFELPKPSCDGAANTFFDLALAFLDALAA